MIEDRRKTQADDSPGRRYEDAKAAASTAADRIEKATKELCQAFRKAVPDERGRAA